MSGTDYDPAKDAHDSYFAAIEAKRERGDDYYPQKPWKRVERINDAVLYLGDCLEILPTLGKVDAVVTDPPYDSKTHDGARLADAIDFAPLGNTEDICRLLLSNCSGWTVAFCSLEMLGAYQAAAGKSWIRAGFWDRISNMPQMSGDRPAQGGEGVAIMHPPGRKVWAGGGRAALWRHLVERGEKQHPTQKPLSLIREIVELFSQPGQTVLGPFMGSGTTGVACVKLGRKFIGIEIDEGYFEIACERIRKAYAQPDMFIETAKEPEPVQQPLFTEAS